MDTYAKKLWEQAISDARNVITIHSAVRKDAGRRYEETSLNRAAVVLAVAAWQSFLQSQIQRWVLSLAPRDDWYTDDEEDQRRKTADQARHQIWKSQVHQAVANFSSPNSEKTRNLFQMVGVDPRPLWTWETRAGVITPTEASWAIAVGRSKSTVAESKRSRWRGVPRYHTGYRAAVGVICSCAVCSIAARVGIVHCALGQRRDSVHMTERGRRETDHE